jgi:outer membrane protein assembly factor BamB
MDLQLSVVRTVDVPVQTPAGLAWSKNDIWLNDYSTGELCQINIETGEIINSLQCPGVISGLAWDGEYLWQTRMDEDWIQRINPESLDFDLTLPISAANRMTDAAWDGTQIWVTSQNQGKLIAIDPKTGQERSSIKTPLATTGLDYYDGRLWISYAHEMEYNSSTDSFAWIDGEQQFLLSQIDPKNGRISAQYRLEFLPTGLAWHDKHLWLSNSKNGTIVICELI